MKSNTINSIWSGNIELELMPSQFSYLNRDQSGDVKISGKSILERAVPFVGLMLAALGAIGIMGAFSSPFSLHGGLLYLFAGIAISLTYSASARRYFLTNIPSGLRSILYDKSIIDILTETSAVAKGYTLLSMIPVLGSEEIHLLSQTLPDECLFLRQKGLVHLLPSTLRDMLHGTQRNPFTSNLNTESQKTDKTDERRDLSGGTENDGNYSMFSSFFYPPSQLTTSTASSNSNASSVNQNLSNHLSVNHSRTNIPLSATSRGSIPNDHNATIASSSGNHANNPLVSRRVRLQNVVPDVTSPSVSGPCHVLSVPQDGDFERTLQDILHRKSKVTSDWLKEKVQIAVTSNVYYLLSGGDMSDGLMVGLTAGSALGVALSTAVQSRIHHPEEGVIAVAKVVTGNTGFKALTSRCRIKGMEVFLKSAIKQAVTCAVPCFTSIALITGSMLVIRKVHDNEILSRFPLLLSSKVMLPIARKFIRKLQLSSMKLFTFGGRLYRCDDPLCLAAVSAWTLTAFLAVKLHQNVKSLRWVFNSIVMKLLSDCCECSSHSPN